MTFAKEAWPFVVPPLLAGIGLIATGLTPWGVVLMVLAAAVLLFFRVPRVGRIDNPEIVLAPAYGRVTRIDEIEDPAVGVGRFGRVVTFLSVFDVHVQRCPIAGTVVSRHFAAGRKVAAFNPRAGEVNESELSIFEDESGRRLAVRQIVGLLARRIVCYLEEGQAVDQGQDMGLIKFGSRVDLLLPEGYEIVAHEGDRLKAGVTVVARRSMSSDD